MLQDGEAEKGSVTVVVREGNAVRRPIRRWSNSVQSLLQYLESAGFKGAPKVLCSDDEQFEWLSFIEGEVAKRPWPSVLLGPKGLKQIAEFLVQYHSVVRGFEPPSPTEWYVPGAVWRPGQVIRHGDLAPWNTVWTDDQLSGVIDWDFAEPGDPILDVAQAALEFVPLRPSIWDRAGFSDRPELGDRLRLLCETYGESVDAVLSGVQKLQQQEIDRTETLGASGIDPWQMYLNRGDLKEVRQESRWLTANLKTFRSYPQPPHL